MNTQGMDEKVISHGLTVMASERAAADPLPGPLVNLFVNGDIEVEGVKVRKAWMGDQVIFKILDSPIHRLILESQKEKNLQEPVDCSTEDEMMLIWQFTHPIKEAYELAKQGKSAFESKAMTEVGMEMDCVKPKIIIEAIMKQIAAAFQLKMTYAADAKEGENGSPLSNQSATA